jgi:hypothetical protein
MKPTNLNLRGRLLGVLALAALLAVVATVARAANDTPAPANVAGTWQLTIDTASFTATLAIQQDGETIKGTQHSDFGDSPIAGTVKGNTIHFTVNVDSPNGAFTVTHDGTVTGDTMKGSFQMGDGSGNSGTWSATRQTQK